MKKTFLNKNCGQNIVKKAKGGPDNKVFECMIPKYQRGYERDLLLDRINNYFE